MSKNVNIKTGRTIRLGVHGSRTLEDERVKILLLDEIEKRNAGVIVTHAEPDGVCKIARQLAKELAIPLHLHFLNFKYRAGAFEHRSKAVMQDSDCGIFIHDGKSKGTQNELSLCKKMAMPHTLHTLQPTPHKTSVGFDIDKDWDWDIGELAKEVE